MLLPFPALVWLALVLDSFSGISLPARAACPAGIYSRLAVEAARSMPLFGPRALADVSIPDPHFFEVSPEELWITGSTPEYLVFKGWSDFFAGGKPEVRRFRFFHTKTGTEVGLSAERGEVPWGIVGKIWNDAGGKPIETLYGAVMMPPPGETNAQWSRDNPNRRLVCFRKDAKGDWVRSAPLFGSEPGWLNHAYDLSFYTDADGTTWAYYARVSDVVTFPATVRNSHGFDLDGDRNVPARTQIYARKLIPSKTPGEPPTFSDQETLILGVDPAKPYPSAIRQRPVPRLAPDGKTIVHQSALLVEGPRVTRWSIPARLIEAPIEHDVESNSDYVWLRINGSRRRFPVRDGELSLLVMGFSANDFEAATYGIHLAVGDRPDRLEPLLNHSRDFINFSDRLKLNRAGSIGAGRPELIQAPGGSGLLYHAATKSLAPGKDLNELVRRPFFAPLQLGVAKDGSLKVITDQITTIAQ